MKRYNIFENFIFACIILVIVQTLLDDISIVQQWPVKYRNILLISGFVFDLIFTIEFAVRSIISLARKDFTGYFWYRRGWVDLFSSVPLLLLNSGPALYIFLSGDTQQIAVGIGVLNVLKVIKAIRVTRVLRLVRIVKIFGKIHNTESSMAQHHTATVTTMAVFSVIITLLVFSVISPSSHELESREEMAKNQIDIIESLNEQTHISRHDLAMNQFNSIPYIVGLSFMDTPIIPLNEKEFSEYYTYNDYSKISYNDYSITISQMDLNAAASIHHILNFCIIIVIVMAFTFIYTRHFAQNVTDVLHILNLGLRKKDYNLQIKIHPYYREHEVYKLARFYNEAYLPAKMKKVDAEKKKSLSMKDLLNFNS